MNIGKIIYYISTLTYLQHYRSIKLYIHTPIHIHPSLRKNHQLLLIHI